MPFAWLFLHDFPMWLVEVKTLDMDTLLLSTQSSVFISPQSSAARLSPAVLELVAQLAENKFTGCGLEIISDCHQQISFPRHRRRLVRQRVKVARRERAGSSDNDAAHDILSNMSLLTGASLITVSGLPLIL